MGIAAWVEEHHPRDASGKFVSGEVSRVAKGLGEEARKSPGGFSWRHDTGSATSGIMVAEHPDRDLGHVIDMTKSATVESRERLYNSFVNKAWSELQKNPDMHLGGWIDEETHQQYLDVSRRYPESKEKDAYEAGVRNNQKSIYHIGRGELIDTHGTGEKTPTKRTA